VGGQRRGCHGIGDNDVFDHPGLRSHFHVRFGL
jgi:hypothetical protein